MAGRVGWRRRWRGVAALQARLFMGVAAFFCSVFFLTFRVEQGCVRSSAPVLFSQPPDSPASADQRSRQLTRPGTPVLRLHLLSRASTGPWKWVQWPPMGSIQASARRQLPAVSASAASTLWSLQRSGTARRQQANRTKSNRALWTLHSLSIPSIPCSVSPPALGLLRTGWQPRWRPSWRVGPCAAARPRRRPPPQTRHPQTPVAPSGRPTWRRPRPAARARRRACPAPAPSRPRRRRRRRELPAPARGQPWPCYKTGSRSVPRRKRGERRGQRSE